MHPEGNAGMAIQQRFCPLCDRAFVDGEAVLRCEGCAVMHHPACWVRNDGCVTQQPHRSNPIAQAYGVVRPAAAPVPHTGEGARRMAGTAPGEPVPFPPPASLAARAAPQAVVRDAGGTPQDAGEGVAIGDRYAEQPMIRHVNPPPEPLARSNAPRRYRPPVDGAPGHAPLPKLYGRHPVLGYWFVPAAALVAVAVAVLVIWASDQIWGGGDDQSQQAVVSTSPTSVSTPAGGFATPAGTAGGAAASAVATASGSAAAAPTVAGQFKADDVVVVAGAGDCLNVRTAPGRANPAIICLQDGTEVVIHGGPERVDDLTWWKVQTKLGEGWAAQDYLIKKQ